MRVILTRPGTSASLLAALYLNLLLCEFASFNYLYNPIWAATVALGVGVAAWLLFTWPAERLAALARNEDPLDALFHTRALAWAARIGLTIWLALCLRFLLDLVEMLLERWLRIGRSAEAIELLPAVLGYTLAAKILSAFWLGLALAGSCRDPRRVASSVRLFNRVAVLMLVGVFVFYRKALSTMIHDSHFWEPSRLAPVWLYLSVSTLLAPVLLRVLYDRAKRPVWQATVLPVAIAAGMGSIVGAALVRTIQLRGSGFTGGPAGFLHAIWLPLDRDPLSVSSGWIYALAGFGFAQILLLSTQLIWRGRLHHPRLTLTLFVAVCWAAGPKVSWATHAGALEGLLYAGMALSPLAGVVAARGLTLGLIPCLTRRAAGRGEIAAALGGGLAAAWAAASSDPWTWVGFAPFLVSAAIVLALRMVMVSKPNPGSSN